MKQRRLSNGMFGMFLSGLSLFAIVGAYPSGDADAFGCEREVSADVVVIDQPLMFNRLGAANVNGMIFALRRDVINQQTLLPLTAGGAAAPGQVQLRPDRRPRPLVLRVRRGDCLTVNLENLLTPVPNPRDPALAAVNIPVTNLPFAIPHDEQPADRFVGFHAAGMQLVRDINDDGSMVGKNPGASGSLIGTGQSTSYKLYAEKEGVFLATSEGVLVGSDGNEGHVSDGLFGQVIVEPTGAAIYRGQVVEEELRLATTGTTGDLHPIINYEAIYPTGGTVWDSEGKGGLPVLNMMKCANATTCEIVHSEINAVIAYGPTGVTTADGRFPVSTYPLESVGKRNPTVPNRLEPFREFASVFHDETANAQAFPCFYNKNPFSPQCGGVPVVGGADVQFGYVLEGVKDAFMINYGSGGIGSEIIANRLNVGPMHDCLDCSYEEFFLTSFTVGDPAMLVNVPANFGLEFIRPGQVPDPAFQGPKATYAIGAEDPSNIHHSYIGDFAKFRNTHAGKEQHVFHLHNHQWLFNPNDDNGNYLDAQGIGPGVGYTYEINFGGSGNRNKSTGDSIFHCHFYPHFAQGMWYHWRHNDTFSAGTILAATGAENITRDVDGFATATGFHTAQWALADTTPAAGARAYPDGEIAAGTPIPAVVPLPGKPMAPMPGRATVVVNPLFSPFKPTVPVGSLAKVIDRNIHPGYPFWVAGMEDIIGQRPPTPPLDMVNQAQATALKTANPTLFSELNNTTQADGWDGGLPRHALGGYAAGGSDKVADGGANVVSPRDFSKKIGKAKPTYYAEGGTALERVAMAYHAQKFHDTYLPSGTAATSTAGFRTNGGGGPVVGAPFHNPCMDDDGTVLKTGITGNFFSGESATTNPKNTHGSSVFNSDNPRIYKGTFLQFDAVFNKVGYHFPQERIVALWQDAGPVIAKQKAPEPMVFRFNTFDCMVYHNSNLVPENYEMDDYQVRTPTDIIAQHIHLPKWDLTTTDGAANGWNYEDGVLSPGVVRERIAAINRYNAPLAPAERITRDVENNAVVTSAGKTLDGTLGGVLVAEPHPYFGKVATTLGGRFPEEWKGARTIHERWFADPVVNTAGVDRGLGIIFTHDHYGPSSHQQIGLYATALTEPAGSLWKQNETGVQLACTNPANRPTAVPNVANLAEITTPCRWDGGPTSWQAQIIPPTSATGGSTVQSETLKPFREFYMEYSDFQHAYEAGVYVGAGQDGLPLVGTGPGEPVRVANAGNPQFQGLGNNPADAFRFAINPPLREQINPVFPELVVELASDPLRCPNGRPCPQAISVQDPGILVVNYRNEPVGLRIFDPAKIGPDAKPGMQADGQRGDLAFALQSRTDRAIAAMNVQPAAGANINGTFFPPPINDRNRGIGAGDPFTPMMRAFAGDLIRVKMQAGGHEEEHNATLLGLKWLQSGSGHGKSPNSGWRNAQAGGISEQFTLTTPALPSLAKNNGKTDYTYSMDAGNDGWWSGMWGILRTYSSNPNNLAALPTSKPDSTITNAASFAGTCPLIPGTKNIANLRAYDISAVLANSALNKPATVTIPNNVNPITNVGGPLNTAGGTLVYNHRDTTVSGPDPLGAIVTHQGPIHDPTAILYVRTSDLDAAGKLKAGAPVEPLVLRAKAGECIQVTLRNKLPALANVNIGTALAPVIVQNSTAPDLPTYSTIQGVVKRDRLGAVGSTRFDFNLFRPSSWVSLTPGLADVDPVDDQGTLVGTNQANNLVAPGGNKTYRWYAGDIRLVDSGATSFNLVATPVEFGGANLMPADKVKQGAKSLVGALVVEPAGSTWTDNTPVFDHQTGSGTRASRAQVTVTSTPGPAGSGGTFRDFSLVLTKGQTHYYRDSSPVEHLNGEGVGIPEDSQEASGFALNYGIEPIWFRFGILPQSQFGNAGTPNSYGSIPNAHEGYSNLLVTGGVAPTCDANNVCTGDPATPVFQANAGQPARIHITNPHGTTRGSSFALHGHLWQRAPYVCPGESRDTLTGNCKMDTVGSRALGNNLTSFYQGGQESWNAPSHFDIVLPSAGGGNNVQGDYLFRDKASMGSAGGIWGIMRVQ